MFYVLLLVPIAFFLGYYLREVREILSDVKRIVTTRELKEPVKPVSSMVEPQSMEELARKQHEQLMKDLNQWNAQYATEIMLPSRRQLLRVSI